MKAALTVLFIYLVSVIIEAGCNYEGYKVYQIFPKTKEEANVLTVFEDNEDYDFWSRTMVLNKPVDLMVSPSAQSEFAAVMEANNLDYNILINNVADTIKKERERSMRSARVTAGEVTFDDYMRHDEINAYLRRLAVDYANIVTLELIGKSFEGRDLLLIKISSGGSDKPMIFADAALHAREWIAPPMALYIINQLVENPDNAAYYQDVDWAIIPVANPDGYEYTHTSVRLWRKTRSPHTICYGVDPNRNFDYQWMVAGASNWQCSDVYAGYAPFSEVETQALSKYLLAHKDNIKLYLAIHSHGQYLIFPWGYTSALPDDYDELYHLGELVNEAIHAVNGANYTIGTSTNTLGLAAGCSDDYAKGAVGISLSYCVELPGGGDNGIDPPVESILPIVQETWEGFKAYHDYVRDKFVN